MTVRRSFAPPLISAASVISGGVVGAVASLYHAAWFPVGLILVLLAVGLYCAGLRIVFPTRYPAVWASVGILVTLSALAGFDSSGSVLIMADAAGGSLLLGVALIVLVATVWPSFPQSRGDTIKVETQKRSQ